MLDMGVALRSQNSSSFLRNLTGTWIFVTCFRAGCHRILIRFHRRLILPVYTASFPNSNLHTDGTWRPKHISRMVKVFLLLQSAWHYYSNWRTKNQLDVTYFIVLLIGSTFFGHYYAHQQQFATMMLITTLVVSFLVCCVLEVRCG